MICVPLLHREETVGVLKVYSAKSHQFDESDVETVEILGELIAAHLAQANLFDGESHHTRHDSLTALPNRRSFEERLPIEVARAHRYDRPLSLCLFDLDGFKGLNDRIGNVAGDETLRGIAKIIDESRVTDDCFRIGGDEFAILMPETPLGEAEIAAERIAARVRAAGFGHGTLGTSYGVASASDLDGASLFTAADRELLAAKDRLYGRDA
jgi:diguanylate cyclase (GGDEF)-like protein